MRNGAKGSIPVSFPITQKSRKPLTRVEFVAAVEATEPSSVSLDGLYATQPSLDPKIVDSFIKGYSVLRGKRSPNGLLIDFPVIVKCGGKRMIWDGHHRCASLQHHGLKTVQARFLDIDKLTETRVSERQLSLWADAASQRV